MNPHRDGATGTSATLLGRLRAGPGDPVAWEEFVNRYMRMIQSWCRRWGLQDADAEEVSQIVLVKLTEKLPAFSYDASKSFRGWLKTVTRNAWSDYAKAQQRAGAGSGDSRVIELLQRIEARDDLEARVRDEFKRDVLAEAMVRVQSTVTAQAWQAFRLLVIEGKGGAEAAALLGMKYTAVFMAKARVAEKVRAEVARLEAEGDG